MQLYNDDAPADASPQPQAPARQLFDDSGRYLGPHRPGVTFDNCRHSEAHGGWGCRACEVEALAWRRAHREAVVPMHGGRNVFDERAEGEEYGDS